MTSSCRFRSYLQMGVRGGGVSSGPTAIFFLFWAFYVPEYQCQQSQRICGYLLTMSEKKFEKILKTCWFLVFFVCRGKHGKFGKCVFFSNLRPSYLGQILTYWALIFSKHPHFRVEKDFAIKNGVIGSQPKLPPASLDSSVPID